MKRNVFSFLSFICTHGNRIGGNEKIIKSLITKKGNLKGIWFGLVLLCQRLKIFLIKIGIHNGIILRIRIERQPFYKNTSGSTLEYGVCE